MSAAIKRRLLLCLFLSSIFQILATNRESWQPPDQIMKIVGIRPGMIIGEVGAGSGYFTLKMADLIGPEGVIYANDISSSALSELEEKRIKHDLDNIKVVHGTLTDPKFPRVQLDLVIMVYVLHDIEEPERFLITLKDYLTEDTPVAIIDRDPERFPGSTPWHFMTREEILAIIEASGYTLVKLDSSLPRDNIYIMKK